MMHVKFEVDVVGGPAPAHDAAIPIAFEHRHPELPRRRAALNRAVGQAGGYHESEAACFDGSVVHAFLGCDDRWQMRLRDCFLYKRVSSDAQVDREGVAVMD